jgi:hypothetical protein
MNTIIAILTISNSIILFWFFIGTNFDITRCETPRGKLFGFQFWYGNKTFLYLPFRNGERLETLEDIEEMMTGSQVNTKYTLGAILSWLHTEEEINQFEKDYSVVDPAYVQKICTGKREQLSII